MAKVVTATNLRAKAREVIQSAQFQGDHVIVTVFDKPAVAIIGINDYRDYLAYRERQPQGKKQSNPRAIVERNTALDELTDEELEAILKGASAVTRIDGR